MSENEFREINVPMAMFNEQQLAALIEAAETYCAAGHEAIGLLIGCMADSEIQRRSWNAANPDKKRPSDYGRILLNQWSDKDIAHALAVTWQVSEHTRHAGLGEFVDGLGQAFVDIAFERLTTSNDARNGKGFVERNAVKESPHDPASN